MDQQATDFFESPEHSVLDAADSAETTTTTSEDADLLGFEFPSPVVGTTAPKPMAGASSETGDLFDILNDNGGGEGRGSAFNSTSTSQPQGSSASTNLLEELVENNDTGGNSSTDPALELLANNSLQSVEQPALAGGSSPGATSTTLDLLGTGTGDVSMASTGTFVTSTTNAMVDLTSSSSAAPAGNGQPLLSPPISMSETPITSAQLADLGNLVDETRDSSIPDPNNDTPKANTESNQSHAATSGKIPGDTLASTGASNGVEKTKEEICEDATLPSSSAKQGTLSDDGNDCKNEESTNGDERHLEEQELQKQANAALQKRIEFLEMELAKTKVQVNPQQLEGESHENETAELIEALQANLQQQMSLKAEAENKARLADAKIKDLEQTVQDQAKKIKAGADMQKVLHEHMNAKAEAESKVRQLSDRNQELEAKVGEQMNERNGLERKLAEAREAYAAQEEELLKIREQRDEQERKEISLTNRLNAAKKKEGAQANLAERYDDEIKAIEQDLEAATKKLAEATEKKSAFEKELAQLKVTSEERVRHAERALADERALNEERKRKMKAFVENKAEELRQVKADNDSLSSELNQTNQSFMDLNNRWKQLHAQWVQSQTRNRELQRDLNRIKKDSENLHKVGDTLEAKLSRSATETEEHKNKRLAAKHELMTVLRALDTERELSSKLRDCLKFTFTPKALSQQQLLHESLEEFEAQLQKLSLRIGRTLPPSSHHVSPVNDSSESSHGDGADSTDGSGDAARPSRSDFEIQSLIAKLEYETQRVSQCIMAVSANIERMHLVLDASGERTCYTVLGELLTTGSMGSSPAAREETASMTRSGPGRSLTAIRSHRYGGVPSTAT